MEEKHNDYKDVVINKREGVNFKMPFEYSATMYGKWVDGDYFLILKKDEGYILAVWCAKYKLYITDGKKAPDSSKIIAEIDRAIPVYSNFEKFAKNLGSEEADMLLHGWLLNGGGE